MERLDPEHRTTAREPPNDFQVEDLLRCENHYAKNKHMFGKVRYANVENEIKKIRWTVGTSYLDGYEAYSTELSELQATILKGQEPQPKRLHQLILATIKPAKLKERVEQ